MRPAVQVRKRNVHGLVLLLGRGESFRNMVDKEHEDVSQDQSYSNVRVRTRTFHLLDVLAVVLVLLGPVHACVAFLVAFCRVIIAALLRLVVLLLFNFLLLFAFSFNSCVRLIRSSMGALCSTTSPVGTLTAPTLSKSVSSTSLAPILKSEGRLMPVCSLCILGIVGRTLRETCEWVLPALYMVSMPSGMMTMSDVPTSTPVPRSVMIRSCRGERVKERGRMPAMNELALSIGILLISIAR